MRRWRGLDEVPAEWGRGVVTIGVFDGVHRGHQHIVGRALHWARHHHLPAVVITFDPHPSEVVRPGSHPPRLSTLTYRADLLAGLGVDAVLVLPFTPELSRLSPPEFAETVLVNTLRARVVVVGENFRFGHRAAGTVGTLAELGQRHGFEVEGVHLLREDGGTLSSTVVRERLAAGDVAAAARVLGRPHRVQGQVVRGDARGRELGYPTANLRCPEFTAIPADGVYAGWLALGPHAGAERLPAAISVGNNPTFDGVTRRVEAYALDRVDLDLYEQTVAVEFVARLREMTRFDTVAALRARMAEDVERSRVVLRLGAR